MNIGAENGNIVNFPGTYRCHIKQAVMIFIGYYNLLIYSCFVIFTAGVLFKGKELYSAFTVRASEITIGSSTVINEFVTLGYSMSVITKVRTFMDTSFTQIF
jgi:hypothetical protein